MPRPRRLSNKQRAWLARYLANGFNATEAARHAKYKNPEKSGWENSNKLQKEITAELESLAMSAEEALARLTMIARADFGAFLDESGQVDIDAAVDAGLTALVKEWRVEPTKFGPRRVLKLHDSQAALVDILRAHGAFTDRVEHSGPDGEALPAVQIYLPGNGRD